MSTLHLPVRVLLVAAPADPAGRRHRGGVPAGQRQARQAGGARLLARRVRGRGGLLDLLRPVRRAAPAGLLGRLDPGVRRAPVVRHRRHRAGDDRGDRAAGADRDRRGLGGQAAGRAQRGRVPVADPAAAGHHDRRVRRDRRVPVLRAVRGHADPDVLPHRVLRRGPAAVRGGQVLPVLVPRRPDHAGLGDRRVLAGGRRARHRHVRLGHAGPGGLGRAAGEPDLDLPRLLPRVRGEGAAGATAHLAAGRGRGGADRRRRDPDRASWTRSARSASCATCCR